MPSRPGRPSSPLLVNARKFIKAIGARWDDFVPERHLADRTKFEEHYISRAAFYGICAGDDNFTEDAQSTLFSRLQAFLHEANSTIGSQNIARRLASEPIDFVTIDENGVVRIDRAMLRTLYEHGLLTGGNRRLITIELEPPPEGITTDQLLDLLHSAGITIVKIVKASEGSTRLTVVISSEDAAALEHAFARGDLARGGVTAVYAAPAAPLSPPSRPLWPDVPAIDLSGDDAREQVAAAWRRVMARERLVRPWRRLQSLMSPSIRSSPLFRVVRDSQQRAYSSVGILGRWSSLKIDLTTTLVVWPATLALLLVCSLALLRFVHPDVALGAGTLTGLAVGLSGAQVCASVVSPLAVGVGTITLAFAFGLSHAVILGSPELVAAVSAQAVRDDPFSAVTGGIVGLAAPRLGTILSPPAVALLLGAVLAAIVSAGWLMGQPMRAGDNRRLSGRQELIGTLIGTLSGVGIGLVLGLTTILRRQGLAPTFAFAIAFTIVGAAWFGLAVWWTTRRPTRSIAFALAYMAVAAAWCSLAFSEGNATLRLVGLSAATAWYHATWFTTAFVAAAHVGSSRASTAATALEGAGGFLGFVLWRMFHG